MTWQNHPWEKRYAREGYVYPEPFLAFPEVVRIFRENGCEYILDLGCGTGRHAVHMTKAGFSVLGTDISRTALKLALAWAREEAITVPLAHMDTRRGLPFASAGFDGILSTQVIHHAVLAEVRRTIEDLHRVLRPAGFAFITVSGRWGDGEPFEEIEPATYVPQTGREPGLPHHIFSGPGLRYEFRAFEVLETSYRADGKVLTIWAKKPQAGRLTIRRHGPGISGKSH
ncbi:MAG: class I SAM-dependent methyltransferase [Anaerolineae bacterium]|nr:class I SAM-dependent methyltransferase [Anaerolineae bacterium]